MLRPCSAPSIPSSNLYLSKPSPEACIPSFGTLLERAKKEQHVTSSKPLIILIAGPYRSGTNDDPHLIAKNLERLESHALPIYRAGHIPMIGEWVALPIIRQAGSKSLGDKIASEFLYPVASRLLQRCDAVLRIEGESKGADEDVRLASQRGLPVFRRISEIPVISALQAEPS